MEWVKDRTGRFPRRPHYLPEELDRECEDLVCEYVRQRRGRVDYPIATDDLTTLIESLADDLDLFADLAQEDGQVEGVTEFFRGRKPKVRISKVLTLDLRMTNRFRTTLTHELGHVKFHAFMFAAAGQADLFGSQDSVSNRCKRDNMINASHTDWMEWQAGFACGAILMPATALAETVRQFFRQERIGGSPVLAGSPEAESVIGVVAARFGVSRDAARVRLLKRKTLSERNAPASLF